MSKNAYDFDCAVIGGGPGGLVSALYLGRFRRKAIVINSGVPRAAWIPKTHNLIGYEKGISGVILLRKLRRQVCELKVPLLRSHASVSRHKQGFEMTTNEGRITARKVILATGIEDVQIEVANLSALRKTGFLRYCPVCDAFEHRGQPIAIFVKDDAGAQKAEFLKRYTDRLVVVGPEAFELSPCRKKQFTDLGIKYRQGHIEGVEIEKNKRKIWISLKGQKPFCVTAAYVEMGCRVRDESFAAIKGIKRVKEGFLTATSEQRLSVPGLFAVGDCVNLLGQIVVAAGQAAVAATTIHNDLIAES